jgi:acetylornithine/succinyldiaminopimelate/putrescine aminotransferase/predicted amino acid dehydrogenase
MDPVSDDFYQMIKPQLCGLLDLLRVGVVFDRGQGDYLYHRRDGEEVAVLDLVGGYGSLLFGHHHPVLVAEAQRLLVEGRPIHSQGSRHALAGRLAQELSRRAGGDYRVVFTNSGAEAVEAGMKHAMLETGARTFIALERGFHGKTLGAVQLTANQDYREPFLIDGLTVHRVRANDIAQLEQTFARTSNLAGMIFEPIQGEGGVREITPEFAQRAAALCSARGVPLIADEIQTGMGRTGTFLASEALGIKPDYVLLSKALGGGLAKISATLIRRDRHVDKFDVLHTSTYAEDDYSSGVALKALELLDQPALDACRLKGERILNGLRRLMSEYPDIIVDVRGRGLMVAVEFRRFLDDSSTLLRLLSNQDDLIFVMVGHLFNVHRIRVAPTLSDPQSLRLEPSMFITDQDIDRVLHALGEVCAKLRAHDAVGLTQYFIDGPERADHDTRVASDTKFFIHDEPPYWQRELDPPPLKVGWLFHMKDADDLISLEPDSARLTVEERERFLRHFAPRANPLVMSSFDVQSTTGAKVRFYAIALPFTSKQMKQWLDESNFFRVRHSIDKAIKVARHIGCEVIALGQYTSIVTRNATTLDLPHVGLTTGNSYTIALALEAVERAVQERGLDPLSSTLAVVGASGNIGQTCAEILAPRFGKSVLLGSNKPSALKRLAGLQARLPRARIDADPSVLRQADVVLAAANAPTPFLTADHFAEGAVVCDLSVPAAVCPSVKEMRSDVLVIGGGIARLPFGESHGILGLPLPPGQVYGCMAETMLLGLEGVRDATFTGMLPAEHVYRLAAMAKRHGFTLAEYKTHATMGTPDRAYAGASASGAATMRPHTEAEVAGDSQISPGRGGADRRHGDRRGPNPVGG